MSKTPARIQRTLRLSEDLWRKIRLCAIAQGFSSANEYIVFRMGQLVEHLQQNDSNVKTFLKKEGEKDGQ